jgi:uncharacterized RDD family membrane protein YckC
MDEQNLHNLSNAGFFRRTMASVYDWLLVIASMMVLSVPAVALLDDAIQPGNPYYRIGLVVFAIIFFVGFWSHGGQTLGMRAWRLQLVRQDGSAISRRDALKRFGFACISMLFAGLGYLWVIVSKDSQSWHDRWSGTTIKLLPKENKTAGK